MATTVYYTGKDGKASKVTFPSRALAESYAKTVRSPRLEDSDAAVPEVTPTVCPVATAEVQRAATNAYYRSVKEPKDGRVVEKAPDWRDMGELKAEHFIGARLAGQSMEDAYSDWDFMQERR